MSFHITALLNLKFIIHSNHFCFPLSVSAEPIIVEVTFRNPLKVSLILSNLSLLWRFTEDGVSSSKESMTEELTITNEEMLALGVGNWACVLIEICFIEMIFI